MAATNMKSRATTVKGFSGPGAGGARVTVSVKIKKPSSNTRQQSFSKDMFLKAFKADPLELVYVVKRGVEPTVLEYVAGNMKVTKDKLLKTLGIPRATMQRRENKNEPLSADASSRLFGITRLIGQVQDIVNESGVPDDFDAAQWIAGWLDQRLPALDGRMPSEFMDTAEGQLLVSRLLSQAQSGAYA